MTLPSAKELNEIDMSDILSNVIDCPEKSYISAYAGKEHYRLLRWISENHPYKHIAEIGCYMGLSTLCLAANKNNMVTTFDINFDALKWVAHPGNVTRLQTFGEDAFYPGVVYSDIIFVDTWHNGVMEEALYNYLTSIKWNGLLILDDIFLNDAMTAFWRKVRHDKMDATTLGHSTGTGIIEMK